MGSVKLENEDNHYATDLSDDAWALLSHFCLQHSPPGGRAAPRSWCDQRDFLSAAHRLSVASSSAGVSSLGHRITISACGRTPVRGLACNEKSMSKLARKPVGLRVLRWSSWTGNR